MTQDEIIRLAHEAGLYVATDVNWMPIIGLEYAEKFAKLVAKHTLMNTDPKSFMSYQHGFEAGRMIEREACAKVCEKHGYDHYCGNVTDKIAETIRARGEQA